MNTLELNQRPHQAELCIPAPILNDQDSLLANWLELITQPNVLQTTNLEFARKPKPTGDKKKEKAKKRREQGIVLPNELNRRHNEGMYEKYRTGIPKKQSNVQ